MLDLGVVQHTPKRLGRVGGLHREIDDPVAILGNHDHFAMRDFRNRDSGMGATAATLVRFRDSVKRKHREDGQNENGAPEDHWLSQAPDRSGAFSDQWKAGARPRSFAATPSLRSAS